ncbi:MAG TPA: hypothetical protein VFZ99_07190 [Terriglobales bacterium]
MQNLKAGAVYPDVRFNQSFVVSFWRSVQEVTIPAFKRVLFYQREAVILLRHHGAFGIFGYLDLVLQDFAHHLFTHPSAGLCNVIALLVGRQEIHPGQDLGFGSGFAMAVKRVGASDRIWTDVGMVLF